MEDTFRSVDGVMSIADADGNIAGVDEQGRLKIIMETCAGPHTLSGTSHTGQLIDSQIPDYITRDSELVTVSGALQTQIDGKSDTGHIHDDRYYTESEADALLADKSDITHNHDSDYAALSHNHTESDITDLDKYTQSEVDALIAGAGGGIFGSEFMEDESTGTSSTTSDSWQTKLSLSPNDMTAGKYRFGWSAEIKSSRTDQDVGFKIRSEVNNTNDVDHSEIQIEPQDTGNWYSVAGFAYRTVSEGDDLDINMKYNQNGSGGTAYIRNARLELWRVS